MMNNENPDIQSTTYDMNLDALRQNIDACDAEIIRLLNKRLSAALDVGTLKKENNAALYVPAREKEVISKALSLNKGPLKPEHLQAIYHEIMSAALDLEGGLSVAYLGPPATYSHQAVVARFGHSTTVIPCPAFEDIFSTVEKGEATYGIVPIENSKEGAVTPVQDLLTETPLKICAESYLKINHCLLSTTDQNKIKKIFSHPQPLAQCRHWLQTHLPHAALIPLSSTSAAAAKAKKDPESAAIGSSLASEIYDISIAADHIQDQADNTTRFLVVGKTFGPPTDEDKTSLFFGLQHKVGALNSMLSLLEQHGINMLKIESRPSKYKQWEYHFFVDIEGHIEQDKLAQTIQEMGKHCIFMTILGSYPIAIF